MSDYVLGNGEKLNGGYAVKIGDYTLRCIGKYSPSWEKVYDTENSFKNYLGNQKKVLIGLQFSLKIETGRLSAENFNALVAELNAGTIAVECPDFSGECYCDDAPGNLEQANFSGTRYKLSFTLIAKSVTSIGDGL